LLEARVDSDGRNAELVGRADQARVVGGQQEENPVGPNGARSMNMNDLQRSAIVATLVKECRARNSFCGETMVQKSVFFLQELLDVPLEFDFCTSTDRTRSSFSSISGR
jgi:hypothetical protein